MLFSSIFYKFVKFWLFLCSHFWALSGRVQRNVNQVVHVIRFVYQAALRALDHGRPS